jgi:disulfide bond formation protein DsbB
MTDTPQNNHSVEWTRKGPALIVGIVLGIIGLFVWAFDKSKSATIAAFVLIMFSLAFIGYSMTIKDWCKQTDPNSSFSKEFSMEFRQCIQSKSWFEF